MTKLSSTSVPGRPHRKTAVWLDERSDRHLSEVLVSYTTTIGRPVSGSLIIRRALRLLADHLRRLDTDAAKAAEADLLVRTTR